MGRGVHRVRLRNGVPVILVGGIKVRDIEGHLSTPISSPSRTDAGCTSLMISRRRSSSAPLCVPTRCSSTTGWPPTGSRGARTAIVASSSGRATIRRKVRSSRTTQGTGTGIDAAGHRDCRYERHSGAPTLATVACRWREPNREGLAGRAGGERERRRWASRRVSRCVSRWAPTPCTSSSWTRPESGSISIRPRAGPNAM